MTTGATMTDIQIISAANKHMYDAWFAKAIVDDDVWPYLSFHKRASALTIENDDWNHVIIMNGDGTAVLEWTQHRSNGMHDASVALWALSGPRQALAAGRLAAAIPTMARRYGVAYVSAACHASNASSVRILTKRFGEPWGRCPSNAWNGLLGEFEDTLHFRVRAA